jgi:hypothetical protein
MQRKSIKKFSINHRLIPMNYLELASDVDPYRPLIYLWEILGSDGKVAFRYVGKASGGAHRPRTQYQRNVVNLIEGRPYRRSKPEAFRAVHWRMAQAVSDGEVIQLRLLCNVQEGQNINALERHWQAHYGWSAEHALRARLSE